MAEHKYYEDTFGVLVTNTRFVVYNQTFAMAQVSSVRAEWDAWLRWSWGLPMLLGSCLYGSYGARSAGAAIFCALVALFMYFQRKCFVVVASSSGETRALGSTDEKRIVAIVEALNQALIARG